MALDPLKAESTTLVGLKLVMLQAMGQPLADAMPDSLKSQTTLLKFCWLCWLSLLPYVPWPCQALWAS